MLIAILLGISALMITVKPANSAPSAAPALISIAPSNVAIGQLGQPLPTPTATLNVTVANITNLFAWQIKIYYDPTVISFQNADAMDPDPSINIFGERSHFWAPSFIGTDARTNNHYLMATSMLTAPETGVNGSGVLCQLRFEGVNPGGSFLNFSRPYGTDTLMLNMTQAEGPDAQYQPIRANLADGSVTVIDPYDHMAPNIGTPEAIMLGDQALMVSVNVSDNQTGVKNATLSYTTDDGTTWTDVLMTHNTSSDLYQAAIPGQQNGANLKYRISAYDNAENYAKNDNAGDYFAYDTAPKFPTSLILLLVLIIIATVTIVAARTLWKRKPGKPGLPPMPSSVLRQR